MPGECLNTLKHFIKSDSIVLNWGFEFSHYWMSSRSNQVYTFVHHDHIELDALFLTLLDNKDRNNIILNVDLCNHRNLSKAKEIFGDLAIDCFVVDGVYLDKIMEFAIINMLRNGGLLVVVDAGRFLKELDTFYKSGNRDLTEIYQWPIRRFFESGAEFAILRKPRARL